jgi:hypothetical protein
VSVAVESFFKVLSAAGALMESAATLVAESAEGEADASAPLLLQAAIATATAITANTFFIRKILDLNITIGRKTTLFLLFTKEKSNRDALEIKVFP